MKTNGARPLAAPRFFSPRPSAGWTLIELSVVLALAAVLIFFVVRSFQPREAIALQQAERLRNDLRHVQMLAITWNQALRVTVTANSYSVSCVAAGASPCDVAPPVVDPATGGPYVVNLESGLGLTGPATLDFDALGRPSSNATFTVSGGSVGRTVTVAAVTGFATAP